MKLINRRCECCGASEFVRLDNKRIKCAYCDSEYIDDEPKQDIDLSRAFSSATYTIPSYVEQLRRKQEAKEIIKREEVARKIASCNAEVKKVMSIRFYIMLACIFITFVSIGANSAGLLLIGIIGTLVFFFSAFAARNNVRARYDYHKLINYMQVQKGGLVK